MTDLVAIHDQLVAAMAAVDGIRASGDPTRLPAPPAVLVSPPELTWSTDGFAVQAEFVAFLMVKSGDRAVETLERLILPVAAAIDDVPDAVVRQATPGVWQAGGTELPSYEIQIEVSVR